MTGVNDWTWWIHPRHAIAEATKLIGCSREVAIVAIARRLLAGKIVAIVDEYRGPRDEGNHLYPELGAMPLWRGVWAYNVFHSPDSPLWIVGDLESSLGDEPCFFFNVRFNRQDFEASLRDYVALPEKDDLTTTAPPAGLPLNAPRTQIRSKWPWDQAYAALIAIANGPDGLEAIAGFKDPKDRGAQARIARWFAEYFAASDPNDGPADSELRNRAAIILAALNR